MATYSVKPSPQVVDRNLKLTGEVMRYLLAHPQIFSQLPDRFELVILPEDDPELRLYNLELLDQYGSDNQPVVFARLAVPPPLATSFQIPKLFVPIALTV
jgi:hypothetical protein